MRYQAPRRSSDGFTLIELMVALLISVFLLGGLMAINQSNRGAFTMQANLVQQTDEQRFAMTMLTEVVQSAGYFDNPATNTATAVFPIVGVWVNSGQIIFGTSGTKGASDTLSTRLSVAVVRRHGADDRRRLRLGDAALGQCGRSASVLYQRRRTHCIGG